MDGLFVIKHCRSTGWMQNQLHMPSCNLLAVDAKQNVGQGVVHAELPTLVVLMLANVLPVAEIREQHL